MVLVCGCLVYFPVPGPFSGVSRSTLERYRAPSVFSFWPAIVGRRTHESDESQVAGEPRDGKSLSSLSIVGLGQYLSPLPISPPSDLLGRWERKVRSSLLPLSHCSFGGWYDAFERSTANIMTNRIRSPCNIHQGPAEQLTRMFHQFSGRHVETPSPEAEATELEAYPTHAEPTTSPSPTQERSAGLALIRTLWQTDISFSVEAGARRDHLANERTFLGWLRTSLALSMLGIFCAQLFTLQPAHLSHMNLSFFVLGVPLGSACQAAAIVNTLVGAHRFWRLQNAIVKGKACTGGWEIFFVGGLITLVSTSQPPP